MTESCNKYAVKFVRGESVATTQKTAEGLISRAAAAGLPIPGPDIGISEEHEIQVPTKTLGELVVDNPAINREREEAYLSCKPMLSNLPPEHPDV